MLRALGLAERLLWNNEAIEHLGEAFGLIEEPRRRARIAIELGRALLRGNRHAEAIEAFRHGREALGSGPDVDTDMALSLETELINAAWWEPEHLEIAIVELEQLKGETLGDGFGADLLRATLGYWETRRGVDRQRALELARQAVASQRLDSLGARALHLAAYTLTMSGCPDEALVVYDRALRGAYARGDNIWASSCALFRAYTQLRRGDLNAVESDLGRYAELMEYETAYLYSGAFRAELARERGDLEGAE